MSEEQSGTFDFNPFQEVGATPAAPEGIVLDSADAKAEETLVKTEEVVKERKKPGPKPGFKKKQAEAIQAGFTSPGTHPATPKYGERTSLQAISPSNRSFAVMIRDEAGVGRVAVVSPGARFLVPTGLLADSIDGVTATLAPEFLFESGIDFLSVALFDGEINLILRNSSSVRVLLADSRAIGTITVPEASDGQ